MLKMIKSILLGDLLRHKVVTKRAPAIAYIALLMIIYIYNIFYTHHKYRQIIRLEQEISHLEVISTTMQSKRVSLTRQSYIIQQIEKRQIPIFEGEQPPITIK